MVTILFTPAHIAAGSLQMTIVRRTNPYISPGRRDGQAFDADQLFAIAKQLSIRLKVDKILPAFLARDPRFCVRDITETRFFS